MIWWVMACSGLNPDLQAHRDAVAAFQAGKAHADAGRWEEAQHAFAESRVHRPEDVLLTAWEAAALAELGELDEAIERLDEVLAVRPTFAEARYNRAAYYARKGDAVRAAHDLERAIDLGAARSRDVLDDPDFRGILEHDALAFLPPEPLTVAVESAPGAVFWGSETTLRLRIAGARDKPVVVQLPPVQAPLELVRVVEDRLSSSEGPFVDLSWTFRATGGGTVELGPLEISSGSRRTQREPVRIETIAPPEKTSRQLPITLATPRSLVSDRMAPDAWVDEQATYVLVGPADRHTLDPRPTELPVPYLLRSEGQTVAILHRYTGVLAARVRIRRTGAVILDQELAP